MTDDYRAWDPATTAELVELFSGAPFRWWITGGVALELYTGRSWRGHADADVGICRVDSVSAYRWLAEFHLYVAADGRLRSWGGRPLSAEDNENNLWAKERPDGPWRFDIVIGEGGTDSWIYRRDPSIRRAWAETIMITGEGVPYLAPEVQLLFKSTGLRDKDHTDAQQVIPQLEPPRREWLRQHLRAGHPWLQDLERVPDRWASAARKATPPGCPSSDG